MPKEIERKFLLKDDSWREIVKERNIQGTMLKQTYLQNAEWGVVRLRLAGEKAYITIKTRSKTIARDEFEYEIPLEHALEIFKTLDEQTHLTCIEKVRYKIENQGHVWEIDEFTGLNQGLVIAEIELNREDETFAVPPWIGEEVTKISKYFNSSLANNPIRK